MRIAGRSSGGEVVFGGGEKLVGLFGKKKAQLVGLDIGSSAVKAVELKSGGKGGGGR